MTMKKTVMMAGLCTALLTSLSANAQTEQQEAITNAGTLTANIKRIAIEYMEHSVSNKEDPNYPDSYNSDEQSTIGGLLDANLTYDKTNMVWVNGIFANYSKNETTEDGITTENENNDECACCGCRWIRCPGRYGQLDSVFRYGRQARWYCHERG